MTVVSIVLWALAALVAVVLVATSVRIVGQSHVAIVERLGRFHRQLGAGLHVVVPVLDRVVRVVDLRTQVIDSRPQPVITKDNVTMSIDTVVYYRITDPFKATYEIQNVIEAMQYLTLTTLRDIIGQMELDETLSSRETINGRLRAVLDEATDQWGVRVERVEVKTIEPPQDIKDAMEKQMRAEREKRSAILEAEGERQSAILRAQGEREAAVLRAQAQKEAAILEAQGKAEAIRLVAEANRAFLEALREAEPDARVLALRYVEALEKLAQSPNKVFVPYEAAGLLGALGALREVLGALGGGPPAAAGAR